MVTGVVAGLAGAVDVSCSDLFVFSITLLDPRICICSVMPSAAARHPCHADDVVGVSPV